jgi:hypothetical protein
MTRRIAVIVVAVMAAAIACILIGRWEKQRAVAKEVTGFRTVLGAIGGRIDVVSLSGWRVGPPDCLAYHDKVQLFAYQLCFDRQGRLIEAVDRRGAQPAYYSLEYEPSLSPLHFSPKLVDQLLRSAEFASHKSK